MVTSCPRSGTIAVGRMLSFGRGVCALPEPFNYHVGLREMERYFEIPGWLPSAKKRPGAVSGILYLSI